MLRLKVEGDKSAANHLTDRRACSVPDLKAESTVTVKLDTYLCDPSEIRVSEVADRRAFRTLYVDLDEIDIWVLA